VRNAKATAGVLSEAKGVPAGGVKAVQKK